MTLSDKIIKLYPDLTPNAFIDRMIVIQNDSDGKGDYIAKWDHPDYPRPTDEQLDKVK